MDGQTNTEMSQKLDEIKGVVKAHLMEEYLPGEDPSELKDSTPLITGGILDSISTVKLVAFLEERFSVEFQAHEMGLDRLNTLSDIAQIVLDKLQGDG